MSHAGPSLTQTKDGLSIAKFSGKTYRFGRFEEPETRRRFDQFKAQWLFNGRKVTDEMLRDLRGRGRSDELTIDRLADRFLEHLDRKHSADDKLNMIRETLERHQPVLMSLAQARPVGGLDYHVVPVVEIDSESVIVLWMNSDTIEGQRKRFVFDEIRRLHATYPPPVSA
jgi:hypothetical protein